MPARCQRCWHHITNSWCSWQEFFAFSCICHYLQSLSAMKIPVLFCFKLKRLPTARTEFIASIVMQTLSFKRQIRYMPKESNGIGRIKAKKGYVMPVSHSTWHSLFLFYSHFFFLYFRPLLVLFGLFFSNFFFLSILYGSLVRMCAWS